MLVSVVPIGNSKGIRIPKSILKQLNIKEKVELEVHDAYSGEKGHPFRK